MKAKIGIIGAGPGGLTSAMILAHRGLEVTVFEQKPVVGGRNAPTKLGDYTFDTGPTFLMMKFILDEVFAECGRRVEDYLELVRLDPLYRLKIGDASLLPSADINVTKAQVEHAFPGNADGFGRFMTLEKKRFERLMPCLRKDYGSFFTYLNPIFLRGLRWMSLGKSVMQNLGHYFTPEDLKLCFAFQSKYLGMSPWKCPAFFTMLSYIEHGFGIYHVMGGLNKISEAMAKAAAEDGAKIRLETKVERLLLDGRKVVGVRLDDGREERFDAIVINADFGHAMSTLVPQGVLRKYAPQKLAKWKVSCSTFMLYLGVNRRYQDLPHHNVIFADDYRRNIKEIQEDLVVSEDPSFYVQNASVTDPTLAPAGKSTIYILVPCPNMRAKIEWGKVSEQYAESVLDLVETRGEFKGLRDSIEQKKIVTPQNWADDYNVFDGATFNLAHTIGQLLYFRPHNRFEELENCYLVGGGTHPGSGLPTIYESGKISSNLLCKDLGIKSTASKELPPSSVLR